MRWHALLALAASVGAWAQPPLSGEQSRLLGLARDAAVRYSASLPSFICEESVQRRESTGPRNVTSDKLSIELTYFDRKEKYKLTAVNGNRTGKSLDSIGGLISEGEFGSIMLRILEPSSPTAFEWKSWSSLRKHRTAVFTYRVPRARSHYLLGYRAADGRLVSAAAGYRGEVMLDAEIDPGRVLRVTVEADDIPKELGILSSTTTVDYDFVNVSGREFTLPVRAESSLARPHREIHNLVRFVAYRKFEVESTLALGPTSPPPDVVPSPPPRPAQAAPDSIPDAAAVPVPPPPHATPGEVPDPAGRAAPAAVPPAATVVILPHAAPPLPPAAVPPKLREDTPPPTFRATSQLALVGFQVASRKGQLIRDLKPDEIELREDGVPKRIAVFEGGAGRARTLPVEIALLFDCSLSVEVSGALSARVFQQNMLDEFENVKIAVYGFSEYLVRTAAPTRDPELLKKAADSIRTITPLNTPLFGAIADAARDFGSAAGPAVRIMAILSDGESYWPGDRARRDEAIRIARASGIALYPVMLDKSAMMETRDGLAAPTIIRPREVESAAEFIDLAAATGGRALSGFMNTDVLPSVLKSIAGQIRGLYVAGYYPEQSAGSKPHKVEIVLLSKRRGQIYGGTRTVVH